jgi:SOS-response transcriptional repressor LexA
MLQDAQGRIVPRHLTEALKVLGVVEAGWPSPAEEELLDTITLDQYLIRNKEATFIARVKDDSMIDIGIMPGDEVLLQRGLEPKKGNIVIATLDSETTIKRYKKVGSRVLLMPVLAKTAGGALGTCREFLKGELYGRVRRGPA